VDSTALQVIRIFKMDLLGRRAVRVPEGLAEDPEAADREEAEASAEVALEAVEEAEEVSAVADAADPEAPAADEVA
jgi:hypothetical protein